MLIGYYRMLAALLRTVRVPVEPRILAAADEIAVDPTPDPSSTRDG